MTTDITTKLKKACVIPASKEVTFECPTHGVQTYTTYLRRDGSWVEPYCPECRRIEKERAELLAEMQADAKERAVGLTRALRCERPLDFDVPCFSNYQPETQEEERNLSICRRFAERFTERELERERAHNAQEPDWRSKNSMGLLLFGNYGTGKTHLAYSILKELDRQGLPGFYITIPDLFDRISDRVNRIDVADVLGKLCMVSCLVLDEIGVQSGDADEKKRLYQIIDGRIKNGRPTILVTNLDRSELVNLLTERVVSRVIQSSYKLFFTGRCRRESVRRSAEEVF